MKSYVITIMDNPKSVECADRCIESGKKHGMEIEKWPAITPKDDPLGILIKCGIPEKMFYEKYSRVENCISAFLSHRSLWIHSVNVGEPVIIFEHDAIVTEPLPILLEFDHVLNIGKPSYGKYLTKSFPGVFPLFSKPGRYFPGAHAYIVKPSGARALVNAAKTQAKPTDLYLNSITFPWLQELFPWVAEADDSFTTIQNETGCLAKHNYNKKYKIESL